MQWRKRAPGMAIQPLYTAETQRLRRIARHPDRRFRWTDHALKSVADEPGRTTNDVEFALMNSQVTLVEWKRDVLWRAVGNDVDGNQITAVVAVYEEEIVIKVVTTF